MHTSGLVIHFVDECLRSEIVAPGPFTLGEAKGDRQAAVLETDDAESSRKWHEWLSNQPGVASVEVVFVHWDEGEQSDA